MNRAIGWFAENHVVANLLMALIIIAGIITIPSISREIFPEFNLDMVVVGVDYLGAAPEEVEEGVCVKIEEEIQDLEGIKRISSTSTEGHGSVLIELEPGTDTQKMVADIKTRIDAIDTFPRETEQPVIIEVTNRRQVIDIAVSGQAGEAALKSIAERVRDELTAIDGVSQVELFAARPYEVSIEVSEAALQEYNVSFDFVANAVRRSSLDLPGGSIRTKSGEILLRTKGQAYHGRDFENIVLMTRPDGTRLLLGDVANVVDGFSDTEDQSARFSGKPAVGLRVFRVGAQDPIDIANKVKAYVAESSSWVPAGITVTAWNDYSRILKGRMDLMLRNARNGYVLVFIILALFLKLRLAWWVSLGIPVSFLGALWFMPALGATINMLSLFAFIVVLGIVVDDAIIVGENIYEHQLREPDGVKASTKGAIQVAMPVIFGVLTTVAAFAPLLYVPGMMGKFMAIIPTIVITVLLFSLAESLFILPAHLANTSRRKETRLSAWWDRIQTAFNRRVDHHIEHTYQPILKLTTKYRYAAVAIATATLLLSAGVIGSGWVKFVFFPDVESDFIAADLTMPPGYSIENTEAAITTLETAALDLQAKLAGEYPGKDNPIKHVFTSIGQQPTRLEQATPGADWSSFFGSNIAEVMIELTPSETRDITSAEIVSRWREASPQVPDATELTFTSSLFEAGEAINVQLTGLNIATLEQASEELKKHLATYAGTFDITDTFRTGKQEIKLKVKPAAEVYGVTLADLARQVRQAFYGEEVQRVQRGRDEVRVMVRYPKDERRSIGDLEKMRIRTRDGGEVPFKMIAQADMGRGYAAIQRVDRRRAINVTADVDDSKGNSGEIVADLKNGYLNELTRNYPGVAWSFEGEQAEQAETMGGIMRGFLFALIIIYAMMAIPFKSYLQPIIVMSVIPFGFVGALWGHVLLGIDMNVLSMFGLVALAGVVVNDSIVLVHFINDKRRDGMSLHEAVHQSGVRRFRPIILTSLTTFAGLTPLLMERSVQAKFLVPMAASLGFGVLFATFITLLIVPCIYLILEDVKKVSAKVIGAERAGVEQESKAA